MFVPYDTTSTPSKNIYSSDKVADDAYAGQTKQLTSRTGGVMKARTRQGFTGRQRRRWQRRRKKRRNGRRANRRWRRCGEGDGREGEGERRGGALGERGG